MVSTLLACVMSLGSACERERWDTIGTSEVLLPGRWRSFVLTDASAKGTRAELCLTVPAEYTLSDRDWAAVAEDGTRITLAVQLKVGNTVLDSLSHYISQGETNRLCYVADGLMKGAALREWRAMPSNILRVDGMSWWTGDHVYQF